DGVPLVEQRSPDAIAKRAEHLGDLIQANLGIALTTDERQDVQLAMQGKPVDPFLERQSLTSVLGSVLANHNLVSFLSATPPSDLRGVTSWGRGSALTEPMINNFALHAVAVSAMDLAPAKPV